MAVSKSFFWYFFKPLSSRRDRRSRFSSQGEKPLFFLIAFSAYEEIAPARHSSRPRRESTPPRGVDPATPRRKLLSASTPRASRAPPRTPRRRRRSRAAAPRQKTRQVVRSVLLARMNESAIRPRDDPATRRSRPLPPRRAARERRARARRSVSIRKPARRRARRRVPAGGRRAIFDVL